LLNIKAKVFICSTLLPAFQRINKPIKTWIYKSKQQGITAGTQSVGCLAANQCDYMTATKKLLKLTQKGSICYSNTIS